MLRDEAQCCSLAGKRPESKLKFCTKEEHGVYDALNALIKHSRRTYDGPGISPDASTMHPNELSEPYLAKKRQFEILTNLSNLISRKVVLIEHKFTQ
ncbi:hypothetical protein J42TS3_15220 [Paenibacillus vini]|uniref:Uncharacterized protein n=1 Tax=Paenibacillus vini TaxID=1476024 RepID=A0ABQ4M923_9BACL|nr:hypothetical protein J42TS3_15220 [Paenibacillus vini]